MGRFARTNDSGPGLDGAAKVWASGRRAALARPAPGLAQSRESQPRRRRDHGLARSAGRAAEVFVQTEADGRGGGARPYTRCPRNAGKGPAQQGAWQVAERRVRLHGWAVERRVAFARCLQGALHGPERGEFWDLASHEFTVYVTKLDDDCNGWQIQKLYRERADTKNGFNEFKNQSGFSGFCAKKSARK